MDDHGLQRCSPITVLTCFNTRNDAWTCHRKKVEKAIEDPRKAGPDRIGGCNKHPSCGLDGSNKREVYAEHKRDEMVDLTSKGLSSEVKGSSARGRGGGLAAGDGGSVEGGDDTTTATTTAMKSEEVALSSTILVPAAAPVRQGGAATHRSVDRRNKRRGRSLPSSAEAITAAASSLGNRSSKTTSRGGAKRARRTGDDDVMVLEADKQPAGASGSATRRCAAVLRPGAKVAVKAER